MQVKRFVAANMRLALNMVREELGADAVILSNKRVPEGVELLTALEQIEPQEITAASHDNPFQQHDYSPEPAAGAGPSKPSKLELEWELMQSQARQRAEALAAELAKQNNEQKETLLQQGGQQGELQQVAPQQVESQQERLAPDVVKINTEGAAPAASAQINDTDLNTKANTADSSVEPNNVASSHAGKAENTGESTDSSRDEELAQMRFELQSMRDLLEQQLSVMAWGQLNQCDPQKASLWRRLKRMGMAPAVAENLLDEFGQIGTDSNAERGEPSKNGWQDLMAGLGQQLPTINDELVDKGGVFAFVGPTGAGKSTTIGKLATRYVLQHGADNIALVTTDTMRIAAHEQLRTFGRILNIPVKVVDKHNSLERVLYSLRHKSLVLVDTAGLNRQDPRLQQQLMLLNELGNRISSVLVIPTTSQVAVIKAAYHTYKTDNLQCCVLTKLDETASLGEAISLVVEKQLPVAYSTDGQAIPDDICVADSVSLIRSAIELAKPVSIDDDVMADTVFDARSSLVKA